MLQENTQGAWRSRVRFGRPLTLWVPNEDQLVRNLYPDYGALRRKLPHRTYRAIRQRAGALGLSKKRHIWTMAELGRLKKLYQAGAPKDVVLAEFLHATWDQISGVAKFHGFHRKNQKFKTTGIAIIDAIRDRADKMNISMVDLDAMARTKTYFKKADWHRPGLNGKCVMRAIEALGGRILVEWDPLTDE